MFGFVIAFYFNAVNFLTFRKVLLRKKPNFAQKFHLKSSKIQLLSCLLAFLVFSALDDDFISIYVAGKSLFERAFIGFVEKLLVCKLCYKLINKAF